MSDATQLESRSVKHDLPLLHPAQAQKEYLLNEALARLEALTQTTVLGMRAAPPAAPSLGDAYLVAADASGPWEGRQDAIATWQGGHWLVQDAVEGMRVYRKDVAAFAVYSSAWAVASTPADPAGGATIDDEARATIGALIAALRVAGIFSET